MQQHRRVLIVDDDPDIRLILATALRQRSIHIDEASDGRAAIDLLRKNRYAVVLLDLMMPGVDGFAVLETIGAEAGAPVVLVVSGAGKRLLDRLDPRKIHGVIKKPFDPLEIAEVVAACTDIRSRSVSETMA